MTDLKFSKVKLTLDGKQVELSLDQIRKKAEQTAAAMKGMEPNSAEWKQARKNLEALHAAEEDLIPTLERVNHYMQEIAKTATTDLGKATRELTKLRDAMPGDHKDLEKVNGFIEKFKDWMKQNRNLGMTLDEAKKHLDDLVNTPTEKLRYGLAAINKELDTNAKLSDVDRATLRSGAKNYEAQIALNKLGAIPTWNPATSGLNVDQLKQEYSKLQQAYAAVSQGPLYGAEATQIHKQMEAITMEIQRQAEAERQLMTEQQRAAQVTDVLQRVYKDEKVTIDELRTAEKNLQEQIAKMEGQNLPFEDQNKLLQAKASLEDIQETISHITLDQINFDSLENEPIERLDKLLKQLEIDEKRLAGVDEQASRQIAENKRKVQQAIQRVKNQTLDLQNAQKIAGERGKHSVQDMQRAYDTLKIHLTTLSTSQKKEIAETRQQMKQLKADIDRVTGAVSNQNSIWKTAVRNITAYVGVFGAFNLIKNKLTEVIRGSEELSDQMAKVRMVSGLAMEDIEDLTRSLAKLDTRTTLQELTELSYIGSKLGFGEMGVGALEEFAKAANQVNVALKEDLGSEAMTALSKITENMGLIKKMGVEQAMLSTSSAMFKLFTTSTAAAGPIVEVTRRLAPMAQISGFATHEILALASASDALMQSEEVAGTAMSKFMMAMQNNHNVIEKTLGMAEGSIATMMKSGKSMEAFLTILDKMSGKNVTELQNVWKLLGSEGDRLIRVILAMANHTDLVRQHLDTSSKAFKEATAVTEEYNIQQETAMGYLQRAENKWRNAFINPDSALAVKEMTKAWYDFTKSITDSDTALGAIKVTVDFLLLSLRALIALLPAITFGLMAKGARMLYDNLKLANIATEGFITSWKKMDAATKSNWIGLIVGAAIQAVYWFKEWASSMSDAEKEQIKLSDAIDKMREKTDEEVNNLSRLKKQLDDTNLSQEDRNALLSKVRKDYDIYLNYLGIEIKTVDELAKHYDALTKVMRQRFAYQEREEYKRDVMGGEEGLRMKRRRAGSELVKKGKSLGLNIDLDAEVIPMLERGLSWQDIYKKVNPTGKGRSRTYKGPYSSGIDTDYASTFDKYLMNFVGAWQAERKKEDEINSAFASEIGDFDYDKWLRTQVKGEFKIEPPKGGKGGKGGSEIKNKFKTAKEQAEGLIAKIDQWYNLQDATINDFAASGKITDDEAKKALEAMKIARNIALEKARTAVASGDDTEWKKFYTDQMSKMMIDHGEWSGLLFEEITKVDVKALHDFLATFDGSEGMKRLDASSFFDTMRKKAAESKKVVSETQAKAAEELNKMLLKYEYFDKAARQFASNLIQIGALGTTAEQMAQGMEGAPTAEQSIEAVKGMMAAMLRQGTSLYQVNPSDAKGVADMIRNTVTQTMTEADYLAGKTSGEQAHWFDLFPAVKDWMENPEKHKQELENFYQIMLQAEQDYYQKRKQSYDHEKRQHDERFRAAGYTDQASQEQSAISNVGKMKDAGIGASFMEQQGLGSIANDPEVLAIQNLIKWRQLDVQSAEDRIAALKAQHQQELADLQDKQAKELALRQAANATDEELEQLRLEHRQQVIDMEAEQNAKRMGAEDLLKEYKTNLLDQEMALATKVAQEFKKRVQTINSLTKPIQDGAKNIGQKFGEMIKGVENDSMTWADIWHSMAQVVGDSIIDMMAQYAQNMIMEKMMNQQSKQEAVSKASVDVAAGTASAAAKTVGQLGWWGLALVPVIAAALHGLLAAAFSSNSDSNSTSTSTPKTKLVSGMLTYDKGNVDRFAGRRLLYDDGTTQVYGRRRYLGEDGRVYTATEEPAPKDGLVTHPIATTVQGQPALVAERGPEIVIGRETTKAIMMNEPQLIKYLADYGKTGGFAGGYPTARGLAAFDGGNLPASDTQATVPSDSVAGMPAALSPDDARALVAAITTFKQTVTDMQQKGIPCYINKYGRGGLIDEVKSGMKFMSKYEG